MWPFLKCLTRVSSSHGSGCLVRLDGLLQASQLVTSELKKNLRQVPFLNSLEDSQLDYLVSIGKRIPLNNGELLFRKGDPGRSMYLILEGPIQIYVESSDGQAAVLGVLESGQFLGEMALLDGGARSAHALTLTPCEVFVLERASFLTLITMYPELLTRLLSGLTERLRRTDERYIAQMAGVAQEVSAPLDAISANVRAIKQDLAAESASPLLRPFVDKIRNAADVIEKDGAYAKALLQNFRRQTKD